MSPMRSEEEIRRDWGTSPRWKGITRDYAPGDVVRLRGTVAIEHTLARLGAERLWHLVRHEAPVCALGALSGGQAVQQVAAGLKSIYVSGWQVAADANTAGQVYPDQSLYPVDSVPFLVRRINQALQRADQIEHMAGQGGRTQWFAPLVADAEAGFGGLLNAFELMKAMIEAGAAAVHFEDQLASAKKCGHMGGKVVIATREFVKKLMAARLAADLLDVPTVVIARTDANSARLLTNDIDPYDAPFVIRERSAEGFFGFAGGVEAAIARGLAYAPYADVLWCETSTPDLAEARRFAEGIHAKFPDKPLAYNCSPSFNWSKYLDAPALSRFQRELGGMGYVYQFVTLAGFHALNASMFDLASAYREKGMAAYAQLQDREFELERKLGYHAIKHQSFVGTGYFDEITNVVTGGEASTTALKDSTEKAQF